MGRQVEQTVYITDLVNLLYQFSKHSIAIDIYTKLKASTIWDDIKACLIILELIILEVLV